MAVVACAINPCSPLDAVVPGTACTDSLESLDTSFLHRARMPCRPWRPRQCSESDDVSGMEDTMSTQTSCSTSSRPWRPRRFLENADAPSTDASDASEVESNASTYAGFSRTASSGSELESNAGTSCLSRTSTCCSEGATSDSTLRSCLKRTGRIANDLRSVCVNYLDEPGRVDIYDVEQFDYSEVSEDWKARSFNRRRCERILRQFREHRRRGNSGQQQGCQQHMCETVVFFDYQLALDVKRLNANPERMRAPIRTLNHRLIAR